MTARVAFDLKYGERARMVEMAAIDAGMPIPEDAVAPPLLEECEFVYRAFTELTTDRSVGMGVGAIPWSSINAYAQRYGIIEIDEFEFFAFLIRACDAAYLNPENKPT